MNKKGYIKTVLDAIRDPERPFQERVFLTLTYITEIPLLIATIVDIITKDNPKEIFLLVGTFFFVPIMVYICLKKNKLDFAKNFIVMSLGFITIPELFFYGGGIDGGGMVWIVFVFIYMGLVLSGRWRKVMLTLCFIVSTICFIVGYNFPELVYHHDRGMAYIDTFVSIILVGMIGFIMTWCQKHFFDIENEKARKAAEIAEELTRSQNRFFSSMSHEIRTPINSILGLNELTLRDQSCSDNVIRNATGIQGSGKMLLALINDILDFSKMEAGSMEIVPVDYNVGDMLSEIVNMIWIKAHDKGLTLNVTVDPKVPTILYGDEVRIKQIIINLLNNAVKYTQHGSVELHIESDQKDERTVALSISVIDTGMGIKKESLPYLFDAFKRVDEEKNRHIEGTGLGLSIVKQLVELMGGTITVNSIYGEGSTFTFVVKQGISDATQIGELNIHSQNVTRKSYEASFRAPEARILIVDDNEMNLEVESKLLNDTEMVIDKAISGQAALELSLQNHYDVILMDHLMPEMDGIECLEKIHNQVGGLNRAAPVIVLTANAGSDNRELYNRAGFSGYLVKPVSGEALENILMKFISPDKMIVNSNKLMSTREDINAALGYSGKMPVIITSTSMCDLPDSLTGKSYIPTLPFLVRTEEGIFKDGIQIGSDELVRYMSTGKNVVSMPPSETAYRDFFAEQLRRAHHIIHIAITDSMSEDYHMACEAAKSFDNVTVINSECLSSATGILVLIAIKLAQMDASIEEIVAEINQVKKRLQCSFIVDTTEYMARKGLISNTIDRVARALYLHPCIVIRDNKSGVGGAWIGTRKRAYKKYISMAFPVDVIPDPEVVFITYIDVPIDTLLWVKEEISKIAYFENVVFKQASAAISSNSGPGSFGIMYFIKSNKSYNISSFLDPEMMSFGSDKEESQPEEEETYEEEETVGAEAVTTPAKADTQETKWYDCLTGIDKELALKNSGSEDAFKTILKIFYDSIGDKSAEIQGYYDSGDWKNYTIKVHALKSSSKLIGAMDTAEEAQLLENAGKEENIEYIREHHSAFMEKYLSYKELLAPAFEGEGTEDEDAGKPQADEFLMESVYEGLLEGAKAMDCDVIDEVFKEIEDYAIPQEHKEKYKALKELAAAFDYDGIVKKLSE
jgi:DegV family protein with EDD domain